MGAGGTGWEEAKAKRCHIDFSFRRARLDLEVDIEQRPQIWMAWPGRPGTRLKTCCKGQHPDGLEDVCVRRYLRRNSHSFARVRDDRSWRSIFEFGPFGPMEACSELRF